MCLKENIKRLERRVCVGSIVAVVVLGALAGCGDSRSDGVDDPPGAAQDPAPASSALPEVELPGAAPSDAETMPVAAEVAPVLEWDSAGVRVVVTDGAAARRPLGWRVDTDPDLVIGREGVSEYQFDRIAGIRALGDGSLVVLDGGSGEIRIYSRSGELLRRSGGLGQGPGEYLDPVLLQGSLGDSLVVFDRRIRRFTSVPTEGGAVRTFAVPPGARWNPIGVVRGGRALFGTPGVIALSMGPQPEGPRAHESSFELVDLSTGEQQPLATYPGYQSYVTRAYGNTTVHFVPFKIPATAVLAVADLVLTSGVSPELLRMDSLGTARVLMRLAEAPTPVTREDVDQVVEAESASRPGIAPSLIAQVFAAMPIPQSMPSFQRLVADDEGWLWAELYRPADAWPPTPQPEGLARPNRWLVFDCAGAAVGAVDLPEGFELHQVGAEFVVGRWVDELGVETVRRYGLHREGARCDP